MPGLNYHFFLKMSCTKSRKWQLLSYSSFLCVLQCRFFFCYCKSVFLLFVYSIVDVFTSVLVCNPDLFSLNRFMTFEQRYTSVALIWWQNTILRISNVAFRFEKLKHNYVYILMILHPVHTITLFVIALGHVFLRLFMTSLHSICRMDTDWYFSPDELDLSFCCY